MLRHRKPIMTILVLCAAIVLFNRCIDSNASQADPRGAAFAGSASCISCHKQIADTYAQTAHFNTSSVLDKAVFDSNHQQFTHYEDGSTVTVKHLNGSYVQEQVLNGQQMRSAHMSVAIGSGEKAQSYAYWKNQQLFQLPLTYLSYSQQWVNSPGYPSHSPYFDRVILSRCLECHASYVESNTIQTASLELSEQLNANTLITRIDCERCHGPAKEHVQYHTEHPADKQPHHITRISQLSKQQQLDLCASCHSGNDLELQRSMFGFRPGDTLANFYLPHFGDGKPNPDVHGKQMQLLQQSACFQQAVITCGTCHSPHQDNNLTTIVAKCMNCHQGSTHAQKEQINTTGCINCHMPMQESRALNINTGKELQRVPYLLRSHKIGVYKL
jgi:hypothetical protein